jgi:putative membrane protein
MGLLARIVLNAVAIAVATWLVPGLQLSGPGAAIIAGALLGLVNALVRPILLVLTFPFTLVTLGLFIFVVNAICLGLTAAIVPGFAIGSYTAAFLGALVVTIVSWILNGLLFTDDRPRR